MGEPGPMSPAWRALPRVRRTELMDPGFLPYTNTRMTTRRFCARPSRVLFGAIGLSSP
jgi:hypothetical protein